MIHLIRNACCLAIGSGILPALSVLGAGQAASYRNVVERVHGGSMPVAWTLLQRMEATFRSQRSYHVRVKLYLTEKSGFPPPVVVLETDQGAISRTMRREDVRMSGVVDSTPFIHDSQYLVAGNHSAYRLTSTGPWKCGGPRNDPISFFTPVVLNAREVVIAARILGTSYVNGHPAWHLQLHAQMRLNNTLPGLHFAAQRIRLDEYIAKDHNRLLRETERLYVDYGRGDREWIDGSFSFTSYDAPVQVTLPSACRGKAQ